MTAGLSEIILYDRENEDREKIAIDLAKKKDRTFIRPFNDEDIIIGQGTAGLEITNELTPKVWSEKKL